MVLVPCYFDGGQNRLVGELGWCVARGSTVVVDTLTSDGCPAWGWRRDIADIEPQWFRCLPWEG